MAENASDFWNTEDWNPHTAELEYTLGIGIFPRLTRTQRNAVRAAALANGYTGARDKVAEFKPGAAPWIDHFTSHPTDPTKTPQIRDRWVWVITSRGDIPPQP